MSVNKTYHRVWLTFEDDEHPVVIEWFNRRLMESVEQIKKELKVRELRDDKFMVDVQGAGTTYRLTFITNFLGDMALYTAIMTHINALINLAAKYVEVKMHFDNCDVRKNRFVLTRDLGLMINSAAPIELRDVGEISKLFPGVRDIWVAGEPNACRKLVGRIRHWMRYCNQYREGFETFDHQIRKGLGKDVAIYIRTDDAPLGRVIHADGYDALEMQAPHFNEYMAMVRLGKVPDIFNFQAAFDSNYDFYAFMEYMLETVDNRRLTYTGMGGYEVVPYEFIKLALVEVADV